MDCCSSSGNTNTQIKCLSWAGFVVCRLRVMQLRCSMNTHYISMRMTLYDVRAELLKPLPLLNTTLLVWIYTGGSLFSKVQVWLFAAWGSKETQGRGISICQLSTSVSAGCSDYSRAAGNTLCEPVCSCAADRCSEVCLVVTTGVRHIFRTWEQNKYMSVTDLFVE